MNLAAFNPPGIFLFCHKGVRPSMAMLCTISQYRCKLIQCLVLVNIKERHSPFQILSCFIPVILKWHNQIGHGVTPNTYRVAGREQIMSFQIGSCITYVIYCGSCRRQSREVLTLGTWTIMLGHVFITLIKSIVDWRATLFIDRNLTVQNWELRFENLGHADLEEDRLCMEDGNLTGLRELTLLTGIPPKKRGFMWTTTWLMHI